MLNTRLLLSNNVVTNLSFPVGFEYYVSYSELDSGQLIRDGQIVSRSVYKDLWDFVQTHPSLLLTEEQWQAELSANEGVVNNYYSSGDGSTTFRLPKAGVIELPVITVENINKFSTDTQRNITGWFAIDCDNPRPEGAFYRGENISSTNVSNGGTVDQKCMFDASRSVGTEHTGSEVKPKTITKLAVVQAFGRVVNTGTLDINDLVNDVNNLIQSNHIKSYTDLSQIGITKGTETLKDIGQALPNNSMIIYSVYPESGYNSVEYPFVAGQFRMIKSLGYCALYFHSTISRFYEKSFDARDPGYSENKWKKIADKDNLNAPDLANKSLISLENGGSWTAPCDGYIFSSKIGQAGGVYLNVWDSNDSNSEETLKVTVFYDFELQSSNVGGVMPVSKGKRYYFYYKGTLRTYFVPSKSANYTLYGEDYRIYVKVVDNNGSPVPNTNIRVLANDTLIVSGPTRADGRFFIQKATVNQLFNYTSWTVEAIIGSQTLSTIVMRRDINKEAFNELQIIIPS